jgi:hypothetical protein
MLDRGNEVFVEAPQTTVSSSLDLVSPFGFQKLKQEVFFNLGREGQGQVGEGLGELMDHLAFFL